MKNKVIIKWMCFVGLFLGFMACQRANESDSLLDDKSKSNLRLSNERGEIEVSYEVQTTKRREVVSYGNTKITAADLVYDSPTTRLTAIRMKIMNDGSLESEIVEKEPLVLGQLPKHRSVSNTDGEFQRKILKGNILEIFDANGKLINSSRVQIINMKSTLEEIKEAKRRLENDPLSNMNDVVGFGVKIILEMAKKSNGKIVERGNDIQEIILEKSEVSSKGLSSLKLIFWVSISQNRLLSSKLIDNFTGKVVNQTTLFYRESPEIGKKIIHRIYSEDFFEDLKSGRREKIITVEEFKDFTFIDNLN